MTLSSWPVSDGPTWIHNIQTHNFQKIFLPNHLLPEFLILIQRNLLQMNAISLSPFVLIQWTNVLLVMVCAVLFFRILRRFNVSTMFTSIGVTMFVFSFSMWHFVNGEIHHFGLTALLIVFYLLLIYRAQPSCNLAITIGLAHASANLLHQEHILMGITIALMMIIELNVESKWSFFFTYLLVSAGMTLLGYAVVAVIVYDIRSTSSFMKWFFQFLYVDSGHIMLTSQKYQFFRLIKGTLMSIHYGAQIVVDYIRYPEVRRLYLSQVYAFMSALTFLFMAFSSAVTGRLIFKRRIKLNVGLLGCITWIISYKFLNFFLAPESPEYHLVSTPPIIVILVFSSTTKALKKAARLILIMTATSIFCVNAFAAILPWKQYGLMMDRFKKRAQDIFVKHDFFISSESNLDSVIHADFEHIAMKELFFKKSKRDGFIYIQNTIREKLINGERVFVYNFIPSDYALRGISHRNQGANFVQEDFVKMWKNLQNQYRFMPTYHYWEQTKSQIYLFNPTADTIWQIEKK